MEHLGSGRGKLLLFGEHAAVYGHPAVGLSLERSLQIRLRPESGTDWRAQPRLEQGDWRRILEVIAVLEQQAADQRAEPPPGGILELESRIPRGLGFGSSASLCVALSGAFASLYGVQAPQRVWEWAHRAEALFHGTPSGVDTGLALLGGLYSFHPHPPRLPEAERLPGVPLHLVVGAVPRIAAAGTLIGGLREKVQSGDGQAREILQRLGELAANAAATLRRPPRESGQALRHLGELALQAQKLLAALGLSTPELDHLLARGMDGGALGGKLSGAGGGGAFFLLCPDPQSAESAAAALQEQCRSLGLSTAGQIYPLSWSP